MGHKFFSFLAATSLSLSAPFTVLAQNPGVTGENPAVSPLPVNSGAPKSCSEAIQGVFQSRLDEMLTAFRAQDNSVAYKTFTTAEFRRTVPLQSFSEILLGTGLSGEFLTWIRGEVATDSKSANVMARTQDGDGISHLVQLSLVQDGGAWKLNTVTEAPLVDYLLRTFPQGDRLDTFVKAEIDGLAKAITANDYRGYHKHLSRGAKVKITPGNLKKIFSTFKKEKLDIALPETGFAFTPCFPSPTNAGIMVVEGDYKNAGFNIHFRFEYAKEWIWKLNGFNIDANPLK